MRKSTIRKKVQAIVLYISVIALIITGTVGIAGMVRIQEDSESALIDQMEQNLYSTAAAKALFIDSVLKYYSGYAGDFARYIHELYVSSGDYLPVEVLPSDSANAGKYAMQLDLAGIEVSAEKIAPEVSLLGNLLHMWQSVIPANEDTIVTVYAATESGFMIAYDKASSTLDEDDKYYSYYGSSWYTSAKKAGKAIFTDIYADAYGRGMTITCAAPFYDAGENFAGVVAMDILISDLYREIVDIELGEGAYAFLVDRNGKIVAPYEHSSGGITELSELTYSLAGEIMSGKTDVSLSDSRIYYAYTPIEATNWKFCIRIPESVILAPVHSMNERVIFTMLSFLGAFVVIVILAVIAARKLSGKLTDPIAALERDVHTISGGNLDYRAEIRTNDEIGDLAHSFNDMAASLKDYIKNLAAVTAEKERIGAELNVATQIQADMLPKILPPYLGHEKFELFATMNPAKEVGGDFYDFFLIDDEHLALVMADVSGKGVPAALFMVIAKTLIKNRAMMGGSPREVLSDVNNQLCEGNEADLFVTVWLGILELSTGKVTASNAGHEYPAIKRKDGKWELFKDKHSLALAAMEGMPFKEYEMQLNEGDKLFVYTDGVPEAIDKSEEQFGTDRMLEALNDAQNIGMKNILPFVRKRISNFVNGADQFDDITMLGFDFKHKA